MRTNTLGNTGLKVSALGFGGGPLGGFYGGFEEAESIRALHLAIDRGVNLVDTSPYYGGGKSEEILGKGLKGGWRDKVVLATKCGRIAKDQFNFTAKYIKESCETSLRLLQTDHVDILQAHDIEFEPNLDMVFTETFHALQDLKRQGKCRFIGMTGYPIRLLAQAIETCKLDVIISYCHATLLDDGMQTDLIPVAQKHGTGIINASAMCMGLLTMAGPQDWHPAPEAVKIACRKAADVCKKHGADLAQLAMQYPLMDNRIATTLVGMKTPAEVESNLVAEATPVNRELLDEVLAALAPVKNQRWDSGLFKAQV
jgi:L-galactose dehydrogenase